MEGVRVVATAPFYDMDAHAMYEADVWKGDDKQRFYRVASDRPYHYLGSARTYYLIGEAFGKDMVDMTR
jgi:hypothetical protein